MFSDKFTLFKTFNQASSCHNFSVTIYIFDGCAMSMDNQQSNLSTADQIVGLVVFLIPVTIYLSFNI